MLRTYDKVRTKIKTTKKINKSRKLKVQHYTAIIIVILKNIIPIEETNSITSFVIGVIREDILQSIVLINKQQEKGKINI